MPFLSNSRSLHSISKSLFFLWLLVMECWLCWVVSMHLLLSFLPPRWDTGTTPFIFSGMRLREVVTILRSHCSFTPTVQMRVETTSSRLRVHTHTPMLCSLFRGTASVWKLCPCLETNTVTDLSTAAKWAPDTKLFPVSLHTPFHTDVQIWNVHALTSKYKFQGGGSLCLGRETRGAG